MANTSHIIFITKDNEKLSAILNFLQDNELCSKKLQDEDFKVWVDLDKESGSYHYVKCVVYCSKFSNLVKVLQMNNITLTEEDIVLYRYKNNHVIYRYNTSRKDSIEVQNVNGTVKINDTLKEVLPEEFINLLLSEVTWNHDN